MDREPTAAQPHRCIPRCTATGQSHPKFVLSASPATATVGTSIVLSGIITGSKGVPTGSVSFFNNLSRMPFPTVSLNASGAATFSTTSLAAGVHAITAVYTGDTHYFPANSNSATVNVSVLSAVLTLSASQNPLNPSTSERLTASVAASGSSGPVPTGSVKFYDGPTLPGLGSVALVQGSATLNVSTLGVGKHSISFKYSGDTCYGSVGANAIVITVGYVSSLAIKAQPQSAPFGSMVQITATAFGTQGVPSGLVSLFDGSSATPFQTVPLNASGAAVLSTRTLSVGQHSISATYGGDTRYLASVSAPTFVIVVPPAPKLLDPTQITATTSGLAYSRATKIFTGTVTLTNVSGKPIAGPFQLVPMA